jgi:hypothetical protein
MRINRLFVVSMDIKGMRKDLPGSQQAPVRQQVQEWGPEQAQEQFEARH